MKQSMIPVVVASALVLIAAGTARAQPSQAQISYEMTIEGLAGGKKNTTLTIESWSWGATAYDQSDLELEAAKDTKTRKRPDVAAQDFYFVIEQSPASAQLVEALVAKKLLTKVTVRSKQTGSDKTFELVLKDVKVSSYQTGGSGYGGGPSDSISFTYKTAKLTVGAAGGTRSADVQGNTP